jgi:CRP-like cAMP-binding protein
MAQNIWGFEKLDICKDLNAMEIHELGKIARKVNFQKGDIITDVNNKSREVYVLIEGQVDIMSLHGISLYRVSNEEIFGELATVGNIKRTAIAVAREESWVMVMNMSHLESLGEEFPNIYKKVYKNIVTSLGIKLARANKLIELLKSELSKSLKNRG